MHQTSSIRFKKDGKITLSIPAFINLEVVTTRAI
jgi:hypothetical protein